jgi:DNA-binding MarR family transcriptional regulator
MLDPDNGLYRVGEILNRIIVKYGRLKSKKHIYKSLTNLTLIDIDTILVIGCGEMKSMSNIAKELGVSFGTPTITIDRLIQKGYVERIRDEEDRRQVFIRLSKVGVEAYNTLIQLKCEATEKIFGILTIEERERLFAILGKIEAELDIQMTN